MRSHSPEDTFAKALGYLVWAWNDLHEQMGHIFSAILYGAMSDVALAAWHSHNSDASQRHMLRDAAIPALTTKPELLAAVKWLLTEADKLWDMCNNAIHSSYAVLLSEGNTSVISNPHFGNRRAEKLKDKDLIEEFERLTARTHSLIGYCHGLFQSIVDPENHSIPAKPKVSE